MVNDENQNRTIPQYDENGFLIGVSFKRRSKKAKTQQDKDQPKTKSRNESNSKKLDKIDETANQTLDNTNLILDKLKNRSPNSTKKQNNKIIGIAASKTTAKQSRVINMPDPQAILKMNPQLAQTPAGQVIAKQKGAPKQKRVINATHPDFGLVRAVPYKYAKRERDEKGRFIKSHKEQQTQTKLLKKLLKKRGGLFREAGGLFGNLLKMIPGVGLLTGLLTKGPIGRLGGKVIKGISQSGNAAAKAATKATATSGILQKLSKKMGKFAGLLGLGLFAQDALGVENNTDDRAEKNKQHIKNTTSFAGGVAGGMLGAQTGAAIGSIIPGVGTAIGGVLGGVAGAVGGSAIVDFAMDKLEEIIDPEVLKKMLGSWEGFTETMAAGAQAAFDAMPASVQEAAKTVQKTIVDTSKAVQKKVEDTSKAVQQAWNNSEVGKIANQAVGAIGGYISNTISSMSKTYRNMGYNLGSKSLKGNAIDCSGWVNVVQQATIADINRRLGAGTISSDKAKAMRIAAAQKGAAGEVEYAIKQSGMLQDDQITADKLKDGMVIGMAKGNNGRYKNIGHVVTVFTDPKTGVKMISESGIPDEINGKPIKAGVRVRTLNEYLSTEARRRKKERNRHLYAGDPYAQERAIIEKKNPSGTLANGVIIAGANTGIMAATVGSSSKTQTNNSGAKNTPVANYAFRFGGGVDEHLHEAALRYQVSENTLRGIALKEGGWTGKDSQTNAIGVGQFTYKTWNGLIERYPKEAAAIGMKEISASNKNTAQDPRRNKRANSLAMGLFITKEIDPRLKKEGIPVTDENRYLVYNIGPGIIPLLAGKKISPEKKASLERYMRINGKKPEETQIAWAKRQGGSINKFKTKANAVKAPINNPPLKVGQQVAKVNQTKNQISSKAIQTKQLTVKALDIAPQPIQRSSPAQQIQLAGYTNTAADNGFIAHMPTRQVSQAHIAHIVSGGTTG